MRFCPFLVNDLPKHGKLSRPSHFDGPNLSHRRSCPLSRCRRPPHASPNVPQILATLSGLHVQSASVQKPSLESLEQAVCGCPMVYATSARECTAVAKSATSRLRSSRSDRTSSTRLPILAAIYDPRPQTLNGNFSRICEFNIASSSVVDVVRRKALVCIRDCEKDPSNKHVRVNSVADVAKPPIVCPLRQVYFTEPPKNLFIRVRSSMSRWRNSRSNVGNVKLSHSELQHVWDLEFHQVTNKPRQSASTSDVTPTQKRSPSGASSTTEKVA